MAKSLWGDGWRTWAQAGLAGLFPMQGRLISRIGRVQRVASMSRMPALDVTRWFGHEPTILRPDLRLIPHQDVALFQSLLGQTVSPSAPVGAAVAVHAGVAKTASSPADKIAATLAHLRDIRGL